MVPLHWKTDLRERVMFSMSDQIFRRHFKRTLTVAGCPKLPRVYSFRYGVGSDLDGKVLVPIG
jgi:hypothetical protein